MSVLLPKIFFRLRVFFAIALVVAIFLFIGASVLRLRSIVIGNLHEPVWERYGILITLIGIPLSLKGFHSCLKKITGYSIERKALFYQRLYALRLLLLELVILFNASGLYVTGSRSFFYMIFITFVSMFLCVPNKMELETLFEDKGNISS